MQKILKDGKSSPMLSNFGIISLNPLLFEEMVAEDVYIVAPFFYAPAFTLGASTYNGVLTLTAGYYETATGGKDVARLVSTSNLLVISQNNNLHHRSMLATDAVIRNMV